MIFDTKDLIEENEESFFASLPKDGAIIGGKCYRIESSEKANIDKHRSYWLTPTATAISMRSKEAIEYRTKWRKSCGRNTVPPGNLAEQVNISDDKPVTDMRGIVPKQDLLNPDWVEWLMGFPQGWTKAHNDILAKVNIKKSVKLMGIK
jgi:hypothetical protein